LFRKPDPSRLPIPVLPTLMILLTKPGTQDDSVQDDAATNDPAVHLALTKVMEGQPQFNSLSALR
jgi:hypothetical protein